MTTNLNYSKVFDTLVNETKKYLEDHNLQAMVLGISGGIDSTVTAAICFEVSKRTGIPLIGRSLPIKNKDDEFNVSKLVGEAFCDDFEVYNLRRSYEAVLLDACIACGDANRSNSYFLDELEYMPSRTSIANGNLQARLRMIHLYDLASRNKGIVISTDNQTEYQLGFWTLHGDVGDFNPLFGLWKTEVYKLASYIINSYYDKDNYGKDYIIEGYENKVRALYESSKLTPTDGLGISNSDLEQIGAKSYEEVDDILIRIEKAERKGSSKVMSEMFKLIDDYSREVRDKVLQRKINSEFKRRNLPICITRGKYE